jgi:hypothetical protein
VTGTPQARKLGLKAGMRVGFSEPPDGWDLTEPPDGLLLPDAGGAADVLVAFFRTATEIGDRRPGTTATSPTTSSARARSAWDLWT